ncbi:MAG: hypothetical protein CFH01_00282 [Alphaproteobacteria bacterium MarineAlpha2_Bin1]|nr:MAG: hypothetical protein CFH01_00282 [Alphaproteobacteria bacterium MarineAlpha2_Bin1]
MIVSLNEIQNLIYRSGLAVKLPAGVAKENSFVAVRMFREGFGSLNVFVKAFNSLRKTLSVNFDVVKASEGNFVPMINKRRLSSLLVSSSVCDLLTLFEENDKKKIIVKKIDEPLILFFHILQLSKKLNRDFKVSFFLQNNETNFLISTYEGIYYLKENLFEEIDADKITIENFTKQNLSSDFNGLNKGNIDFFLEDEVWLYFSKFSDSLLVEDSIKSRIHNAGSGLNDND